MSVISKENKKALADFIDELTKYKNPFLEGIDGWIYGIVIGALDDNFLVKIKPEYYPDINLMVEQVAAKQYEDAAETLGNIAARAIDTPLVDGTPEEIELYAKVFRLIAQLIKTWIEKSKVEEKP